MIDDRRQPTGFPLALLTGDRARSTGWLETLLESGGYGVLLERTGRHLLQRARMAQPDVVVVHADLPDMRGVEVCRALRQDVRIPTSTPVLLCLPEPPTREQRLEALRAGAWDCIAPPHDGEELLLRLVAYIAAKLDADRARAEGLLDPSTGLYNRQGMVRRASELGSQAFRDHASLACVVFALDVEPPGPGVEEDPTSTVARYLPALKATTRLSDVIGRLSPAEFAVFAAGTDAAGARRLAERLASSLQVAAANPAGLTAPRMRMRCGYEAVANVGYAPGEPGELLVRAAAALRTGKTELGGWIRRLEDGAAPTG